MLRNCMIITLLILSATSNVFALQGEKEFNQIKETIVQSTKTIFHYGADTALNELNENIKLFDSLYDKIKKVDHVDSMIDEVTDSLIRLSKSYTKISDMGSQIFKIHSKELGTLKDMEGETLSAVKEITDKKNEYLLEIKNLKEKLRINPTDIEKQKIEISIKGNNSVINSLEAQELIWQKFYSAQDNLLSKLKMTSDKIGLLLHILKTNADVYKNAADVAKLRRSALVALKNLSALSDVEAILGDIENNWLEINDLVDKISDADFRLDFD